MDRMDILIWAVAGGFTGTGFFLRYILKEIKTVGEDVKDIDRRLCRLEGVISTREQCLLRNDKNIDKAGNL